MPSDDCDVYRRGPVLQLEIDSNKTNYIRWSVPETRITFHDVVTKLLSYTWGHDPWETWIDIGQSVFNSQHYNTV